MAYCITGFEELIESVDNGLTVLIGMNNSGKEYILSMLHTSLLHNKRVIFIKDGYCNTSVDKSNNTKLLVYKYPELKNYISEMTEGTYSFIGEHSAFIPNESNKPLTMKQSPKYIQSLKGLAYYIHQEAVIGDVLIIEEPELHLDPSNLRTLTRLIIKLVNLGINVSMTTINDYIIKELNLLIMFNSHPDLNTQIALGLKYEYQKEDKLRPEMVKAFECKKNRNNINIIPINVDKEWGMGSSSIDEVIIDMNNCFNELSVLLD